MNTWNNAVLTTKGASLLSKLISGNTLTITKAQTGAGRVSVDSLASQTAVTNPKQTMTFRTVSYPADGQASLPCYLGNDALTTGYTCTQVGIFANDPNDGEILFFIAQADTGGGTPVPSNTEMPGFTAEWTFYFTYGQAESVSVTVSPANTVSQVQVETMISNATFDTSQISAGTLPVERGGTGQSSVDTTPTEDSAKMATSGGIYAALQSINASQIKGGVLPVSRGGTGQSSVDFTPTAGSAKMVTSGGVYSALHAINTSQIAGGTLPVSRGGTGNSSVDTTPTSGSTKMVTSGGVYSALNDKQNTITYGTGAPSGGSNGDVYIRYNA